MSEQHHLLKFQDGPMRQLLETGTKQISAELFGWPLPKRLGILSHREANQFAIWDADDPDAAGLPDLIVESPNAVVYIRIAQSEVPEPHPNILRGATYRLEAP